MNSLRWDRIVNGVAIFMAIGLPMTAISQTYQEAMAKLATEIPLDQVEFTQPHTDFAEQNWGEFKIERAFNGSFNPYHKSEMKGARDSFLATSASSAAALRPSLNPYPDSKNSIQPTEPLRALGQVSSQPALMFKGPYMTTPGPILGFYGAGKSRVSLAVSREQVYKTLAEQRQQNLSFEIEEKADFRLTQVTLQFMDERSSPAEGRVYPVSGVKIFVLGTNIVAETDPTGIVTLSDVPTDSDIKIRLEDPNGIYVPAHYEVSTSHDDTKVARLFAYRDFALGSWMTMTGIVPDANYGTLCGSFAFAKGADLLLTLEGSKANGPYYFNELGLIDVRQTKLGDNGKYCLFNVEPGTIAISLKDAKTKAVYSIAVENVFPGLFFNLQKDVVAGFSGRLKMGILPPGQEELYTNRRDLPLLRSGGEGANMEPMGLVEAIRTDEGGMLSVKGVVPGSGSKLFFFNHSSEFDDAFYAIDQGDFLDDRIAVPLLPRGFSEDLGRFANQLQDRAKGTILVFDVGFKDLISSKMTYELYDINSRSLGKAWQYSADVMSKSMFFNVEPGPYTLVSRMGSKLVQMRTVMVFGAHTSVVTLGARIRFVK